MKYLNLVLATAWFIAAGFLYFYDIGGGRKGAIPIPYWGIALILGIFNLVRWWTTRIARQNRERGDPIQIRRPRLHRESDNLPEPDPNFTFIDPNKGNSNPTLPGTNGTAPPPTES